MKQLGYIILGIALGILFSYLFKVGCDLEPEEPAVEIIKPRGLITPQQAIMLDTAYNKRHRLISDSIIFRPGGDNRSSWYGLEDVKNYLKYADSQATALGYTLNGLRIYAGAYETTSKFGAGYTTFFIIPTGEKNTAKASSMVNALPIESSDIPESDGLNAGEQGNPPYANYPH
ncbi:MAG TPA: hypothetical protein VFF15_09270 [Flavobacteriaceae bacterium]|nr:hypothetical protein [Flavobacteriaceae bacterium]